MAPFLIGKDALDHAILTDTLFHKLIKLGPDGVVTGALAALDIALWDLKGKLFGQPVHRLLGGAWRTSLTFYASIGHNACRTVDEVVKVVERRVTKEKPAAVKIRWDGDRTRQDVDIPGDIAKAKAVRKLVGDDFVSGFDANNGYSVGGAMRVGRALEDLGYAWFEEPVQHYHVRAMGEVAQRLDIPVSAGEQTYTLQGLKDLIEAGVRMVQPDIVKMGGITGLMQCAALAPRARRGARAASDPALGRAPCEPARALDDPASAPSPSSLPTIGSARARCSRTRPSRRTGVSTCRRRRVSGWSSTRRR